MTMRRFELTYIVKTGDRFGGIDAAAKENGVVVTRL
jgi:hypothetical protein